jgi:hypothetical protein
MKAMNVMVGFVAFLVLTAVFFCLHAFYFVSFDIGAWTEGGRASFTLIAAPTAIVMSIAAAAAYNGKL